MGGYEKPHKRYVTVTANAKELKIKFDGKSVSVSRKIMILCNGIQKILRSKLFYNSIIKG